MIMVIHLLNFHLLEDEIYLLYHIFDPVAFNER